MLRLTIKGKEIVEKKGKNARGDWVIREQAAWMEINGERRRLAISLRDNAAPYEPGTYEISDESYYVDQYGGLQLGKLTLTVVAASAARVAG